MLFVKARTDPVQLNDNHSLGYPAATGGFKDKGKQSKQANKSMITAKGTLCDTDGNKYLVLSSPQLKTDQLFFTGNI